MRPSYLNFQFGAMSESPPPAAATAPEITGIRQSRKPKFVTERC
jgi:hypothetical protein